MAVDVTERRRRLVAHRSFRALQTTAIRVSDGPLRPVWVTTYAQLVRVLAAYLRAGSTAAVYVKGSFGRDDAVLGLSDLGLVVIVPAGARAGADVVIRQRWHALARRLRPLAWLVNDIPVYAEPELARLGATCFAYGSRERQPPALFHPPDRSIRLATLPDLWGTDDWRLVSGPERRPRLDTADPDRRRLAIWLDLQSWWRHAVRAAAAPDAHWAPYLCVKLVAEPLRILLWLEHGERHHQRVAILQRGLQTHPEEAAAIRDALDLRRRLHRVRVAPVAAVLPCFVRLTSRIAAHLAAELDPLAATTVELLGVNGTAADRPPTDAPQPLCDWWALVRAPAREESFVAVAGWVGDPSVLAGAAARSGAGDRVTLLHDELMVRPHLESSSLRSLGFPASDPVSAALVAGRATARYPDVSGWSATDTAARAVAEHRAWLRSLPPWTGGEPDRILRRRLSGMFSAARAALFQETLAAGVPALTVTYAASARVLAGRVDGARGTVEDAFAGYRTWTDGGPRPSVATLDALGTVVRSLPCYRAD